ncbi:hypothetical protein KKI17_00480 [Patescibacteria group bacterium]|nr:hypothetical protein [Patescibacteria group bacterium]
MVGILGYGEVGKAVAKFYRNPRIKDIGRDDGLAGVEVLHVCIPWSRKFEEIVLKEIKSVKPGVTVIHSSVAPGTTKRLISKLPPGLRAVAHSPIRGVHPNLYKGIKTFVKYIGAEDSATGNKAKKHLESVGMKCRVFVPAVTTELGKLLSTTYYGLVIAWHGEMAKMCKELGVDFDKAVTDFNRTYNEGYTKLGKRNVVRPVLYPPKGGLGGHCVIPNGETLKKFFKSTALDFLLEYKEKHHGNT